MCLQNLIARRRANEIIRQQYGLVCKKNCSYIDLMLYQHTLTCPTEEAGLPPFSDSDLPTSPDQQTDCSGLDATIATVDFSSDLCTGELTADFIVPVQLTEGGDPPPEDTSQTYELEVIGSGTLTLPPNTLLQVLIFEAVGSTNVKVGTTVGGEEVVFELPLSPGVIYSHTSNLFFKFGIILYFTGTYNVKIATRMI